MSRSGATMGSWGHRAVGCWWAGCLMPRASCFALVFVLLLVVRPADAWLLHEHNRIGAMAIQAFETSPEGVDLLGPTRRKTLNLAWALVRTEMDVGVRLCPSVSRPEPAAHLPDGRVCIGLSTLPSLAADHSCTPDELAAIVLEGTWVVGVLEEANRLAGELSGGGHSVLERLDARRSHDLRLQLEDSRYLTRAGNNTAHFAIARVDNNLEDYLRQSLTTGQSSNATALYVNYHVAAIRLALDAQAICRGAVDLCPEAAGLVWRALYTEAFALHFLQDSFSSGHFVGAWGGSAQRLGTHDYYCRHGVDAQTWAGDGYIANGDAFLKDEDTRRASIAVAKSLGQVLDALVRRDEALVMLGERSAASMDFDACQQDHVPSGLESLARNPLVLAVIEDWPKPALRSPEMPRFRAEVGLFAGVSLALDGVGSLVDHRVQPAARMRGGLFRIGYGSEGALSRYIDSRVFGEVVAAAELNATGTDIGIGARVHLPFAIVPLLELPFIIAGVAGWKPGVWVARQAGMGSIYGHIQKPVILTEDSTLQFELFRDFSVIWYPLRRSTQSWQVDIMTPWFDFKHRRAYEGNLASEVDIELGTQLGVDARAASFGVYLAASLATRLYGQ